MRDDRIMIVLKWVAVAVGVLWIGAAGWGELTKMTLPDGFRSTAYKREAEHCRGSFESRYECKNAIIITNDNSTFNDWALRLLVVFGPPGAIALLYGQVQRRRERQAEEERERRAAAHLKKLRKDHEEARRISHEAQEVAEEIVHPSSGPKRRPA
jgi:hypothetical protein